jgi:DNA polymerase-3 subunit delta'
MSLKEIFCQDKAIVILQRALAAGKVPHAYIFAGPEGVGKFKTAGEWAKLLLCENPTIENDFADSCSLCRSCQLYEAGSHPDFNTVYKELLEFTRDNKGKKTPVDLPIDVIREFLIEKVQTRPTLSKRKVFVVSEAERLNTSSQNALLKSLEEPPEYCCIVLLCTRMERLLPTTKSRCQIIRFAPVAEDKIIEKLTEMGLEKKVAQYFARLAQGSLGRACQWAQLELAEANLYQTKKQLLNSLAKYEYAEALDLAQWFLDEGKKISTIWADLHEATSRTDVNRRAQKTLVQIIISALHDAMQLNVTPAKGLINFDQEGRIQRLAGRFNPEQAAEKINDCYKTLRWIESGVNEKLIFDQLLLNLTASGKIKV